MQNEPKGCPTPGACSAEVIQTALDALYCILNVEGAALRATRYVPVDADLDSTYHFEQVRKAIKAIEDACPGIQPN